MSLCRHERWSPPAAEKLNDWAQVLSGEGRINSHSTWMVLPDPRRCCPPVVIPSCNAADVSLLAFPLLPMDVVFPFWITVLLPFCSIWEPQSGVHMLCALFSWCPWAATTAGDGLTQYYWKPAVVRRWDLDSGQNAIDVSLGRVSLRVRGRDTETGKLSQCISLVSLCLWYAYYFSVYSLQTSIRSSFLSY